MSNKRFLLFATVGALLTFREAQAQEDYLPQISVVHPGPQALISDLKSVFDLTDSDKDLWIDVEDLLVSMALGVDPERPIRIDVLSGLSPINYVFWVPFEEFNDLRDSLQSLDFPTLPVSGHRGLFRIMDLGEPSGWLRELQGEKTAAIILTTPDTSESLKQLILKLNNPAGNLQALLERKAGIALAVTNKLQDPQSLQKRQETLSGTFAAERDALKRRPEESQTEFELRKNIWSATLDEVQRVLVDADVVHVWANLAAGAESGVVHLDATAIADSSFAQLMAAFGQVPDQFASIKALDGTVLSGRINHPVDALRQKNLNSFLDLTTADIEARVASSTVLSASEKQATLAIASGITPVVRDGATTGNINGFVEATHDGSEFTMVGGMLAPQADRLKEPLRSLAEARSGNSVELDIATVGDFNIHKFVLAEGFIQIIDRVFGKGREFYIGLSDDQVWFAVGPGAQELLKAKIGEMGEPAVSDKALSVKAKMHPWVNRWYELAQERAMPTEPEKRQAWRDDLQLMKQLSESLVTDDDFIAELDYQDSHLTGEIFWGRGFLRFIGRRVAQFAKEQLQ